MSFLLKDDINVLNSCMNSASDVSAGLFFTHKEIQVSPFFFYTSVEMYQ